MILLFFSITHIGVGLNTLFYLLLVVRYLTDVNVRYVPLSYAEATLLGD